MYCMSAKSVCVCTCRGEEKKEERKEETNMLKSIPAMNEWSAHRHKHKHTWRDVDTHHFSLVTGKSLEWNPSRVSPDLYQVKTSISILKKAPYINKNFTMCLSVCLHKIFALQKEIALLTNFHILYHS